ncbi:MAG: hypothetical protein ACK4E8_05470, partial [Lacibacter sp.]
PASSNHIFCIARNTGQLHQKKHDLTMRAKIKTDTVYATVPRNRTRTITLALYIRPLFLIATHKSGLFKNFSFLCLLS